MKKFFCFLLITHGSFAQTQLENLVREDSVPANALAAYSSETRHDAFVVCGQPQMLNKIQDLESETSANFRLLIAGCTKEEQKKIWNLVRYNQLISDLSAVRRTSENKAQQVLQKYPAEIRDDAMWLYLNKHELLLEINQQQKQFSFSVDSIIHKQSVHCQQALKRLIKSPDVISLLHSNMHFTVALGDCYEQDSSSVINFFDSLAISNAKLTAEENDAWIKTIENDSDASNELKQSATEYAKENGYNVEDYTDVDPVVVQHYTYIYAYPYWCGYPWWYEYECWYPYPMWFHSGFYFWHGNVIWVTAPSYYFVEWHFHHHNHFYHYPHITETYFQHYYGPRHTISRNAVVVHQWVSANNSSFPRGFLEPDVNRSHRIEEYGKLEMEVDRIQHENPLAPIDRDEIIKKDPHQYPHLQVENKQVDNPAPAIQPMTEPKRESKPVYPEQHQRKDIPKIENAKPVPLKTKPVNPSPSSPKNTPAPRPHIVSPSLPNAPKNFPQQKPQPEKQGGKK